MASHRFCRCVLFIYGVLEDSVQGFTGFLMGFIRIYCGAYKVTTSYMVS